MYSQLNLSTIIVYLLGYNLIFLASSFPTSIYYGRELCLYFYELNFIRLKYCRSGVNPYTINHQSIKQRKAFDYFLSELRCEFNFAKRAVRILHVFLAENHNRTTTTCIFKHFIYYHIPKYHNIFS